jgi:hypothetical protein
MTRRHPPPAPQLEQLEKHRQYWRDIILGVNGGLASTFLLVAAVEGGSLSSIDVLLTAISEAIAGAVSCQHRCWLVCRYKVSK